jgi:hypothetical protein
MSKVFATYSQDKPIQLNTMMMNKESDKPYTITIDEKAENDKAVLPVDEKKDEKAALKWKGNKIRLFYKNKLNFIHTIEYVLEMNGSQKTGYVIKTILKPIGLLGCLYFFICSLELMSISFRLVGGNN